jgi:hypothetical protein
MPDAVFTAPFSLAALSMVSLATAKTGTIRVVAIAAMISRFISAPYCNVDLDATVGIVP